MHACQYGMTSRRPDGTQGPVFKPTRWLSNSAAILARLSRKCSRGQHDHVQLVGGRAAAAAVYPPDLCLQILRGFRDQLRHDEALMIGDPPVRENPDDELNAVDWVRDPTTFRDKVT
eukprot:15309757-Heterocapsa_arctica.AAC.1